MNKQLIEKYRDINVYHHWWDSTYENFTEDMQAIGIQVDNMYFSGFWSQGDGACFEGMVSDWRLFLKSLGYDNPPLTNLAEQFWNCSVDHRGHYYHENCTLFSMDMPCPDDTDDQYFAALYSPYPDGDFRSLAWLAALKTVDYSKFEDEFKAAFRGHMQELYKRLEQEYEYLTSDEAVWDAIVACGLDEEVV